MIYSEKVREELKKTSADEVYVRLSEPTPETHSASTVVKNPKFVHNIKMSSQRDKLEPEVHETDVMIKMLHEVPVGKSKIILTSS